MWHLPFLVGVIMLLVWFKRGFVPNSVWIGFCRDWLSEQSLLFVLAEVNKAVGLIRFSLHVHSYWQSSKSLKSWTSIGWQGYKQLEKTNRVLWQEIFYRSLWKCLFYRLHVNYNFSLCVIHNVWNFFLIERRYRNLIIFFNEKNNKKTARGRGRPVVVVVVMVGRGRWVCMLLYAFCSGSKVFSFVVRLHCSWILSDKN